MIKKHQEYFKFWNKTTYVDNLQMNQCSYNCASSQSLWQILAMCTNVHIDCFGILRTETARGLNFWSIERGGKWRGPSFNGQPQANSDHIPIQTFQTFNISTIERIHAFRQKFGQCQKVAGLQRNNQFPGKKNIFSFFLVLLAFVRHKKLYKIDLKSKSASHIQFDNSAKLTKWLEKTTHLNSSPCENVNGRSETQGSLTQRGRFSKRWFWKMNILCFLNSFILFQKESLLKDIAGLAGGLGETTLCARFI